MNTDQFNTVALNIYALLLVIAVIGAAIGFLLVVTKRYRLGGTILVCSMLAWLTGIFVKIIASGIVEADDLLSLLLCASGLISSFGFVGRGIEEGR